MNQPLPVTAEPIIEPPAPPARKFSPILVLVVVILLIIVGAGGIILGKNLFSNSSNHSVSSISSSPTPPISQTTLTPTPALTFDSTTGWKTYSGTTYSISFPKDWQFKNFSGDTGFTEGIALVSPSGSSSLQIGLKYDFPYDLNQPEANYERKNINVTIGKKLYSGEEINYKYNSPNDPDPYYVSFSIIETPDLVVNRPSARTEQLKILPFTFMFGNDYPLGYVGVSTRVPKLERILNQYLKDKEVIIQILSTFKFTDQKSPNLSKTSPDASYTVTETMVADYNTIVIKDSSGKVITDDLIKKNEKAIGYGTKFSCQCGTSFAGWTDGSHFILKIVNGKGEEYQYLVDASTGLVNETSFKKVK